MKKVRFLLRTNPHVVWALLLVVLSLALSACAQSVPQLAETPVPITGTGTLEGREVTVASELGGRIINLYADEGESVVQDAALVRLDDAPVRTQIAQAAAAVAAAEANLARLKAGSRAEEIRAASAALELAQAQAQSAEKALLYARDAISNPMALNLEIAQARMERDLAEFAVENAEVALDAETFNYHIYVDLKENVSNNTRKMWDLRIEAAERAVSQAEAERDAAQADLYALYDLRDTPLSRIAELHGAEASYTATLAAVAVAQANLDKLKAGTRLEELAIAQAQADQARAGLTMALTQQSMLTLTAPISGIISSRAFYTGEIVPPGIPIFTLADIDTIYLTLYVPENRIAEVYVGMTGVVAVDAYPSTTFQGVVEHIGLEAEFTPRTVETAGDRARRVFAVRIAIPNADYKLRPGSPAQGTLVP